MRRASGIRCCRTCSGRVSELSSAAPRREPCRRRAAPITPIRRTGSGRRCTPSGLTPRLLRPEEFDQLPQWGLGLTDIAKHVSGMDRELPPGALGRQACAELKARIEAAEPKLARVYQPCRGAAISRPSPPASANSPSALAEPASGSCRRPRRPRAGIGTGTSTGGERSRMRRGTKRRRPQCHTRECQ